MAANFFRSERPAGLIPPHGDPGGVADEPVHHVDVDVRAETPLLDTFVEQVDPQLALLFVAGIDEVGLLRVGPHSAGAAPGPACYGRGGTQPTVTDANLLLGYYDAKFFLGGRMALDLAAAERALADVGGKIGLDAIQTAWGIHRVVTESMAAAARNAAR